MRIPVIVLDDPDHCDPFMFMYANLIYCKVDKDRDTCNIIKNRYGVRGVVSLTKLEEFKKLALQ